MTNSTDAQNIFIAIAVVILFALGLFLCCICVSLHYTFDEFAILINYYSYSGGRLTSLATLAPHGGTVKKSKKYFKTKPISFNEKKYKSKFFLEKKWRNFFFSNFQIFYP